MIVRNVALALLGVTVLVLKRAYHGPLQDGFHSYAGNFAVSFALYFAALNSTARYRRPRLFAASLTLLAVEAFEATHGFGVMANVYDRLDFIANAAGVGVALIVDVATGRRHGGRRRPGAAAPPATPSPPPARTAGS